MSFPAQHPNLAILSLSTSQPEQELWRKIVTRKILIAFLLLFAFTLDLSAGLSVRAESTKSFVTHLPRRLAAFTVGTAVGTPVAIARCTHREVIKQTKVAFDLGDMPKPFGYVTAGFFGIPSGILFGVGCGSADGLADSWINAKDAPYSKDSFSLAKLKF